MLCLDDSDLGVEAFATAARKLGIPLAVVRVRVPSVHESYECAFALIRPDQVVAWRGDRLPGNPQTVLNRVVGRF